MAWYIQRPDTWPARFGKSGHRASALFRKSGVELKSLYR